MINFGARPDRFDERDFPYRPRLTYLPDEYGSVRPEAVGETGQDGGECVGWAVAALIELLMEKQLSKFSGNGERSEKSNTDHLQISPHMIYETARMYDEWEGESYSGSSCRGALKAWHHHGACEKDHWPNNWFESAPKFPLGAYYRVDRRSLTDLRLAIHEAGAVLVSAAIHRGWQERLVDPELELIKPRSFLGHHAFLLVGYNSQGFLVQNSWGDEWGNLGFARLPYGDWLENGIDAWVVALSVETEGKPPRFRVRTGMHSWREGFQLNAEEDVWTMERVRRHSLVFGKNGRSALRELGLENGASELSRRFDQEGLPRNLIIFFLSGLEKEEDSISALTEIGPILSSQYLTPLFIIWHDGLFEDILRVSKDLIGEKKEGLKDRPEAIYSRFQVLSRRLMRPFWLEAQKLAEYAALDKGGLQVLVQELHKLRSVKPNTKIHLAAHSAGVLPLLQLLKLLDQETAALEEKSSTTCLKVSTCSLFAPLCSAESATDLLEMAFEKEILEQGNLHCELLPPDVERVDSIGEFYPSSLPTLVSCALERDISSPVLALDSVWNPQGSEGESWHPETEDAARGWRSLRARRDIRCKLVIPALGKGQASSSDISKHHAAFGGDPEVLKRLRKRIWNHGKSK